MLGSHNAADNWMIMLGRIYARMKRSVMGIKAPKYYHSMFIAIVRGTVLAPNAR